MTIRKADKEKDYDKIWVIFSRVIQTGDTYVFHPDTPKGFRHQTLGMVNTYIMFKDLSGT